MNDAKTLKMAAEAVNLIENNEISLTDEEIKMLQSQNCDSINI